DETTHRRVEPGGGERHFYHVLGELNRATTGRTPPSSRPSAPLFEAAWQACQRRYPELLETRVNRVPWSLFPLGRRARRERRQRMRMATVFTEVYGLPVDAPVEMVQNEALLADHAQQFLID